MWTQIVGPIPNKNGQLSCKIFNAMIRATSPQLSKYAAKVITSAKIISIPLWEMGKETCQ
jgi:hypothetical protein